MCCASFGPSTNAHPALRLPETHPAAVAYPHYAEIDHGIWRADNHLAEHLLGRYRKQNGGFALCGDHCEEVHHLIVVSPPLPESDIVSTIMSLRSLSYADEWNQN